MRGDTGTVTLPAGASLGKGRTQVPPQGWTKFLQTGKCGLSTASLPPSLSLGGLQPPSGPGGGPRAPVQVTNLPSTCLVRLFPRLPPAVSGNCWQLLGRLKKHLVKPEGNLNFLHTS